MGVDELPKESREKYIYYVLETEKLAIKYELNLCFFFFFKKIKLGLKFAMRLAFADFIKILKYYGYEALISF